MNSNEITNREVNTIMDVVEASRYFKISEAKLRRLVTERRVPHFRIDGRILFYRPSCEQWIQSLIVQPEVKMLDVATTIWSKVHGGK